MVREVDNKAVDRLITGAIDMHIHIGPESRLKRKQDAGAALVFTQLFYENDAFYRWRDRCRRAGVTLPIVPGLMAVSSPPQLRKIAELCGAALPEGLMRELDRWEDEPEARARVGAEWCIRQAKDLLANGAPGIHLYCLNRSHPAIEVGQTVRRAIEASRA